MVASPWLKSKPPTGKINKKSPGFNHTIREPNLEVDESWCALPKPFASFCAAPQFVFGKGPQLLACWVRKQRVWGAKRSTEAPIDSFNQYPSRSPTSVDEQRWQCRHSRPFLQPCLGCHGAVWPKPLGTLRSRPPICFRIPQVTYPMVQPIRLFFKPIFIPNGELFRSDLCAKELFPKPGTRLAGAQPRSSPPGDSNNAMNPGRWWPSDVCCFRILIYLPYTLVIIGIICINLANDLGVPPFFETLTAPVTGRFLDCRTRSQARLPNTSLKKTCGPTNQNRNTHHPTSVSFGFVKKSVPHSIHWLNW